MRVLLLALLLVATPSWGATGAKSCSFTSETGEAVSSGSSATATLNNNDRWCWRFVNADGTATADSAAITVTAISALIVYDHGTNATTAPGVNDAEVKIRHCVRGTKPSSSPENACVDLGGANGNASLTGLEGTATAQNNTIRVGPGVYYIDVVTRACQVGATCQVSVQAEGGQ